MQWPRSLYNRILKPLVISMQAQASAVAALCLRQGEQDSCEAICSVRRHQHLCQLASHLIPASPGSPASRKLRLEGLRELLKAAGFKPSDAVVVTAIPSCRLEVQAACPSTCARQMTGLLMAFVQKCIEC